jgi:hypothetical protein
MATHRARARWPVAFRSQRGELLYSWLARTAGVYDLSPRDLLPQGTTGLLSILVDGGEDSALKTLSGLASIPLRALKKMTLSRMQPAWPAHWRVASSSRNFWSAEPAPPVLQACFQCLDSEAQSPSATPFLRLRWQCTALTICPKHRIPLQQTCTTCHHDWWPVSQRTVPQRYEFVCGRCGRPGEENGWRLNRSTVRAGQF